MMLMMMVNVIRVAQTRMSVFFFVIITDDMIVLLIFERTLPSPPLSFGPANRFEHLR